MGLVIGLVVAVALIFSLVIYIINVELRDTDSGLGMVLFALVFIMARFWYITVSVLVGIGIAVGYAIFG